MLVLTQSFNVTGGVAQMVERSLSMREVPGSIPGASKILFFSPAGTFQDNFLQFQFIKRTLLSFIHKSTFFFMFHQNCFFFTGVQEQTNGFNTTFPVYQWIFFIQFLATAIPY